MNYRLAYPAACGLTLIGVAYAVVTAVGIAQAGRDPIVDPVLAMMEVLTLFAAVFIVMLLAGVYDYAQPERKVYALVGLCFGSIMAGLTSCVHFVTLTAGRQTGLTALEWPSTLYAVELLAWDVFLGIALLFAALAVGGSKAVSTVRWSLAVTSLLCLLGAVGPLVGDMALQRIGIAGYGIGLPISSALLALTFRRKEKVSLGRREGLLPGTE